MQIKLSKKEIFETDDYTVEELIQLRDRLQEKVEELKGKIRDAKVRVAKGGEHADADWWNRVNFALKRWKQSTETLKEVIADRRRKERQESGAQAAIPGHFLRAARDVLPRDQFERIMAVAVDRFAASQAGHSGHGLDIYTFLAPESRSDEKH